MEVESLPLTVQGAENQWVLLLNRVTITIPPKNSLGPVEVILGMIGDRKLTPDSLLWHASSIRFLEKRTENWIAGLSISESWHFLELGLLSKTWNQSQ